MTIPATQLRSRRPRHGPVALSASVAVVVVTALLAGAAALGAAGAARQVVLATAPPPSDLFAASRRSQTAGDLAAGAAAGVSSPDVVRSSIRRVGSLDRTTYVLSVNTDRTTCFTAAGTGGGGGACVVGAPLGPHDDLVLPEDSTGAQAALTPDGYDTAALRRRGFQRVAPNLWVLRGTTAGG